MGENMSIEIPIDIVKAEHGEATHRTKGAVPGAHKGDCP